MVNFNKIPNELKVYPNWCCWKTEERNGKLTKIPVDAKTGKNAESNNPKTWSSFEQAVEYYENKLKSHYDSTEAGIGFFFSEDDPYSGIDLDDCVKNGKLNKTAKDKIDKLNSYTELSPSSTGTHTIVRAIKPGEKCRTGKVDGCSHVEVYDKLRYFTFTGNVLNGYETIKSRQKELAEFYNEVFNQNEDKQSQPKPQQTTSSEKNFDDQSLVGLAFRAKNGEKFKSLWTGNWQGLGYPSQSEADLAFCEMLAFWTGGDRARIDRLFRQSGLYREKWDRNDYRERTIDEALSNQTEYYKPKNWTGSISKKPQGEDVFNELDNLLENTNDLSSKEESQLIENALSLIAKLKKSDQDRYIKILSDKFDCRQTSLRDDMKQLAQEGRDDIQFEGRSFGNIYEVDEYDVDGNQKIGYVKVDKFGAKSISTFVIRPKSKLWIDDFEAVNATFISENQEIEDIVIERQNWNSIDSFMSVIPSTDMNWSGTSRKDVQAVMSIVNSYDVPVQIATRQVGWHKDKIWVAKGLNMDNEGKIEPVKVFYYPMGGSSVIDNVISYDECPDNRIPKLEVKAKKLVELNESDVTIPIIGWFHAAFTKRWWLDHPNLRHFPHLNVVGSRGSGKSTLSEIFWRVFGFIGDELFNCSATRFALLRTFSATNSYPIVLDEFKPANMTKYTVANLSEFMRHSYGGAVDHRGRPDQSVLEYHLTAPICLVGETPYYPLEAAAIERVIPVHMNINIINPDTEEGEGRNELCYELQQVDWTGYLPRYIRYLTGIDFETQVEYAKEDALRYLGERDVPRRIWDNIATMIFGLRQYEEFVGIRIDDNKIKNSVDTIATNLCGKAGNRGKLAFELALEQMAVMAETGRLELGIHYQIINENQIALRLSACLAEFRRFVRETNWTGEVLDDNAYRRQITEIQEEGRLIVETSKLIRGWQADKAQRGVIIQNDENIDLSGFLEENSI